ncbi:MAG: hypothetical protein L3J28_09885 [Candidatus Polarisedimenticolaceae bacterium]|nr:hypothetical protein [Candidatus Polarisedimenticolaceae bacterium]
MAVSCVAVLLLSGCASSTKADYFELRENRVGKTRDILISEIGEPSIQLHAPHRDDVAVMRYIYMNKSDGGECVDVYVIERESGRIIEYICQ